MDGSGRSMKPGRAWMYDSPQSLTGRPGITVRLCCDRFGGAVRLRGPAPEVGEDLLNDLRLLDEGDDPPPFIPP